MVNVRYVRPISPLRLVILSIVCVLSVAGCAGSGTIGTAPSEPVSGGTLTFGINDAPGCFDIHVTSADIAAEIQRNVVDSLVSEDSDHKFHPWLATAWTVADDLRSYTFTLRKDVTFTDGTFFTAAAVKANFDHIVAPATKSQYAKNLLGPYTGTDVVDDYTVRINFSAPFAPFLQAASTPFLGFYSPQTLATAADKLCAGGPVDVGSGPFVFTEYTKGQSAVMTRNPNYRWGPEGAAHQGPAYLDSLVFRILPEDATRVGALTSGQVDIAKAIPPIQVRTVEAASNLTVSRVDQPGLPYGVHLNTAAAPLDDQRVRAAIQQGIDVAQDVQTVYFGQYKRAWGPLSPTTAAYEPGVENSWHYDPQAAGRLLDEAGWTGRDSAGFRTKNGQRLSLFWPALPESSTRDQRNLLDQAVQADLAKIGVEVQHPHLTAGEYNARVADGRFQLFSVSWARSEADLLRLFFHSANIPPAGQNVSHLKDPQIDEWTGTGAATTDRHGRDRLYGDTQRRVLQTGAMVPLYVLAAIDGASQRVHGQKFDPNGWLQFYDAWKA
ncbi:ABC transporter substrate-binding protein [Nocardia nova]|uniref:ABC transporter substrate-binding protein n=1 Tax=Nocardia nova TaxID=37330 RepID=A0A2S6AJT2_9NOCA|nr:ABC transporter substrate-binding protein [Nocardia nova]PPJ35481.1 ABC transporter substrate-binding protein [Nocardia nova]